MAAVPDIIPPRESFIDERTKTISRAWFRWLLEWRRDLSSEELMSAFDASIGAAATAELAKDVETVRVLEAIAVPPLSERSEWDRERLLVTQAPVDQSADIQAAILLQRNAANDQSAAIQDVRLLDRAHVEGSGARKIAARVALRL